VQIDHINGVNDDYGQTGTHGVRNRRRRELQDPGTVL